jgi:hypothetical protein
VCNLLNDFATNFTLWVLFFSYPPVLRSGEGAFVTAEIIHISAPNTDVSAHQEQTRRLVRAMMTLTGETASGLARAAGLTPSTVNRFMHRPVRHTLSQRTMLALMTETFRNLARQPQPHFDHAALTELAPAITIYRRGVLERAPGVQTTLAHAMAMMDLRPSQPSPAIDIAPDLPVVLAATRNVDIHAGDFKHVPLKTSRPAFLGPDPRAFALLMPDGSMAPRFDAGDMLYASPARKLDGDKIDVVLERAEGGFIVGSLVSLTEDTARVSTLAPRARETYARNKLRGIYRVVGVQRLGS